MLIDRHLPQFDVAEYHQEIVDAPPHVAYEAVKQLDFARSPIVVALMAIRRLRFPRRLTLDTFTSAGFVVLDEQPGEELVLGAVGKFWLPAGGMRAITAAEFDRFDEPGFAKAVMTFAVLPHGDDSSLLTTQTRVVCTDDTARRRFRAYWRLVGPFSGLIRRRALTLIKRDAQRAKERLHSNARAPL